MAGEKSVFIVAVDESKESFHALEWTMDHFFKPFPAEALPYKLIILHAKPIATSYIGLAGPGAAEVLPIVEHDLKTIAARVIDKAKDLCYSKSVTEFTMEVVEGDARNVLCETVDKHHASMLIVGSHGYGAIKRHENGYQNAGWRTERTWEGL